MATAFLLIPSGRKRFSPAPLCWCEKSGKYTARTQVGPGHLPSSSDPASSNQLPGDHIALDLVGAFADDHQRRVAKVAFDVVFGGVAVTAVDAYGVQGNLHRDLGGEQFGHSGFHVATLAAVVALGGIAGELTGGGEFGRHVGEGVADGLMLPNRPPEALPLLCVSQRVLERGRRHSQGAGSYLDAACLESLHHLRKALAHAAAQNCRRRQSVVIERQLTGL